MKMPAQHHSGNGPVKITALHAAVFSLLTLFCLTARAEAAKGKIFSDTRSARTVPVRQVAANYGFIGMSQSGKQLTLRTKFNTLLLEGESRKAVFNNVSIWLNYPVEHHWNGWHINQADIDRTILPLVNLDGALAAQEDRVVVLDAGHGGRDKGASSRSGLDEKDLTLDVARKVRAILLRYRVDARLTRNSDSDLELEERVARARGWNASLLVSIHFNSAGSSSPSGIETHILAPAGCAGTAGSPDGAYDSAFHPGNRHDRANMALGYLMQKSLLKHAGGDDRGVRRSRFYVLKNASCPATLLECGFLSNKSDLSKIGGQDHIDRLARGIAEGIMSYLNAVKRANSANRK